MNAGLVGLAIVLAAGGVAAVSARDGRTVVVALGGTAAGAALLAPPPVEALAVVARGVAAVLAAYLMWIVVRDGAVTRGSAMGWGAELLVAGACFVAAAATGAAGGAGETGAAIGPSTGGGREALMAGAALGALAIGPLLVGRDALRLGAGLILAVVAASLLRAGLGGPVPAFEQLALAGLVLALGAATAAVATAALRAGGTLDLAGARVAGAHREPADGHRAGPAVPGSVAARSAGTRRIPGS